MARPQQVPTAPLGVRRAPVVDDAPLRARLHVEKALRDSQNVPVTIEECVCEEWSVEGEWREVGVAVVKGVWVVRWERGGARSRWERGGVGGKVVRVAVVWK